jgi:phospholipid/cholesterol/gamma-HCH transport system substrate-binding protein
MRRTGALAGIVIGIGVLASGCGLGQGLYNVPLPGGADLGDHPYTITAVFADALNLVPQAAVKVDNVPVGEVTTVTLTDGGRAALVTMRVNGDVQLPANATATLSQTSLLGEKFVALAPPSAVPPVGRLAPGGRIGLSATADGVQVEDVLGALSALLNGGGVGQLHEIAGELNDFAHGNEQNIRAFLSSAERITTELNRRKGNITAALDSLATLSGNLRADDNQIATILTELSPGIAELAKERDQLIGALDALNRLSAVTVSTLNASEDDIIADMRALAPVLRQLADAGRALPASLQTLLTYPFTDAATNGIRGDYLNAYVTEDLATPGGTTVASGETWPGLVGSVPPSLSTGPGVIPPPPGMLPPTSSSGLGLPSVVSLTPPTTTGGSGSGTTPTGPTSTSPGTSSPGTSSSPESPPDSSTTDTTTPGSTDDTTTTTPTGGG